LFEARFGLALLPLGRRRQTLEAAFARLLKEDLENRVLDFDSAAATEAASLAATICNSTAWGSHQIRQDIGIEQKSHRHKSTGSAGSSSIGGNSSSSVASVARMASSEFGGAGSMISRWPPLRMIASSP
jgi:hypothetical protein